ncbi:MAG TPA: hypothetical protein VFZ08_00715 [Terriglobia bacterium]|nr:hypothetical protein [Terriglobia bacterium]
MRKLLVFSALILSILLVSPPRTFGQIEFFGGYSYLRLGNAGPSMKSNANGWEASVALHLLGPFGAELDYSNHYGISPVPAPAGSERFVPELSQMVGPRFNLLSLPRVEPFVHALFGTLHGVAEVSPPPGCTACSTTTVREDPFAMAFGGGINVKATHHIWLRLIQADYVHANFSSHPQNDTRISTGFVLRFGRW